MRRINFFSLISVLSLALGVGVLIGNNPTSVLRLSPEPLPEAPFWRSGVHLIHNGWFVWRDAPYGDLFNGAEVLIPAGIAWLGAIGFVCLLDRACRRVSVAGWLLVGFAAAAILFGRDPLAWSCLAATMTTAFALALSGGASAKTHEKELHQLSLMEEKGRYLSKKAVLRQAVQIGLLITAAFLSRQFFPVSFVLALALTPSPLHRRIAPAVWGAVTFALVAVAMTTPSLPPLDYPVDGQVTDWVEATEMARPLVGPHAPIQVVDIRTMQSRLAGPLVVMAILSAAALRIATIRSSAWVALAGSLLALWDTFPLRALQESSPLLAFGRLFHHGTTYPVAWLLAGSLPVLLAVIMVRARRRWLSVLWIGGVGAIILLDSQHPASPPPILSGRLFAHLAPHVLFTPSRLVIEQNERAVLAMLRHRDALSRPLSDFGAQIAASSNTSAAQMLLSPTPGHRWSPGGGVQRGSEWLAIRLSAPDNLVGILLNSGAFTNDFARGLLIAGAESCPETWLTTPDSQSVPLRPLATINHWMGPIVLTPEKLPYYGLLPAMTVHFTHKATLQCLLIQQTGRAKNDWSLTSVELLMERERTKHPEA